MARDRRAKPVNENLELWKKVEETDPFYTKEDKSRGAKMTAINPHYQLRKATKVFGPFGSESFRVENENFEIIRLNENDVLCLYTAILKAKYNERSIQISLNASGSVTYKTSKGSLKVEKEFSKKISTDALTKGLSKLGFNADVFLGKFDDKFYVKDLKKKYEKEID